MRGSFSIRTKNLLFGYTPILEGGASRLAVSVAKKVAKRAVDRNRLKRECRHALRTALPALTKPIVGIVRIMNKDMIFADFVAETKDIFNRVSK